MKFCRKFLPGFVCHLIHDSVIIVRVLCWYYWLWIYESERIWKESVSSYSSYYRPCRCCTLKGYPMTIRPVPVSVPICSTNYCVSCQESNRVLRVSLSQSLHFIHLYLHVALSKITKGGGWENSKNQKDFSGTRENVTEIHFDWQNQPVWYRARYYDIHTSSLKVSA